MLAYICKLAVLEDHEVVLGRQLLQLQNQVFIEVNKNIDMRLQTLRSAQNQARKKCAVV